MSLLPKFRVISLEENIGISKALKKYRETRVLTKQNFYSRDYFKFTLGMDWLLATYDKGFAELYLITKAVLALKGYHHKHIKEILFPKEKHFYLDIANCSSLFTP